MSLFATLPSRIMFRDLLVFLPHGEWQPRPLTTKLDHCVALNYACCENWGYTIYSRLYETHGEFYFLRTFGEGREANAFLVMPSKRAAEAALLHAANQILDICVV